MTMPAAVESFLAAVHARDAAAVAACFTPDGVYHFAVPQEPARGREAIAGTFAKILEASDRVQWDIVTSTFDGDRIWLERVDRFWFSGREVAIECVGVVELDGSGLIAAVRDYCDMATWRARRESLASSH
ncbi:nuclear transport factor 2 family protein [Rhodococcus pseudokoreensis]|jgi:limonene-1,2-epoxide hydrolase|uniref:Nuclear transport factor 2 family protein n=1 Tax=Rhodococcus pseudokoreensis TaxID=2811421 RepID=A0A974ZW26_9NOCA|nr:nuclear transport factor 2 family protein [Rhodococcus pseudokoreensis]QSE92037.1 nuclear transport factor 2 family protein [Rhodococcus pseudokoreensis]